MSKSPSIKAIHTKHSIGENPIQGCWAQKTKSDTFVRLFRQDGTYLDVSEGEKLQGGTVSLEDHRVVIGESCMPLFDVPAKLENLKLADGYARSTRTRKDQPSVFMFETKEEGKDVLKRFTQGQNAKGYGKVEVLQNGHLRVGDHLVPVFPKQYEIMLKSEPQDRDPVPDHMGREMYRASMRTKLAGEKTPHKIVGYFLPAKWSVISVDGVEKEIIQPAGFREYGPDGLLYETATFYDRAQASNNDPRGEQDKTANVRVRSLEEAMQKADEVKFINKMKEKLEHIDNTIERIGGGFTREDHPLFDEREVFRYEELIDKNSSEIDDDQPRPGDGLRFSFMAGAELMKTHSAKVRSYQRPNAPRKQSTGPRGP